MALPENGQVYRRANRGDLGAPDRDATYGWGELDTPSALTASSR